jgi:hypothetical protein
MTYTLSALRADLRALLLDLEPPWVWPDAALNQALWEAVAAHSYLWPQEARLSYGLAAGATSVAIYAADWVAGGPATASGPTAPGPAELISVQRVELPAGTPIPADPGQVTDPAASGSPAYRQAWRWRGNFLYLRNPARDAEVGPATLIVELLQTYSRPDAADTVGWNGPPADLSCVYLLAQRAAYQQLAAWQARDATPVRVDVSRLLDALEVELRRAISLRQRRAVRSRTLDI